MKSCAMVAAVSLCVFALAVSATAQSAPKTEVTGVPPFALGTAMSTVLSANRALQPSTDTCSPQAQTTNYGGKVTAPVDGYPYAADVLLCFYKGSLGAVRLTWSSTTFQGSVEDWRASTRVLARQLATSYAPALIKRNVIDEDFGGTVEIRDGQGNILTMISNSTDNDNPSIMIWYIWAAYDHAVNGEPPTVGPY